MHYFFNKTLIILFTTLASSQLIAQESITGRHGGYRCVAQKASVDPYYLQNFRSIGEYRSALEISQGTAFAEYLLKCAPKLLPLLDSFRTLDSIGNPEIEDFPNLGPFSATNLRYIVLADQMMKLFTLPDNAKIAEIGAGFGGQCYILSKCISFSNYYIYDLPEVEALIAKMMESLSVMNTHCIPIECDLPEEKIDLVISNYAFSECDLEMQMDYFEKVIKKADRGFLIYNQIAKDGYHIEGLTPDQFIQLLKANGIRARLYTEFPSTAPGNRLIVWDKTK